MGKHESMREPTYFLLTSLLDGPLHGYAIIRRTEELSEGRVRLAAGTLYAALDRLGGEGLIIPVREETVNGRARRYYALTEEGTAAVQAEAQRMMAAARIVIGRRAAADSRGSAHRSRAAMRPGVQSA
jgi:PadR family transcriptional regulator, regulatory protein PadR